MRAKFKTLDLVTKGIYVAWDDLGVPLSNLKGKDIFDALNKKIKKRQFVKLDDTFKKVGRISTLGNVHLKKIFTPSGVKN
jgi:hypothetical protein